MTASHLEFPLGRILVLLKSNIFYKVFWVVEASQTCCYCPPAADWRLTLSPWTTGNFRPYGCQCLCLRSRVSLWAPKAKPLIGHGSSIKQSNPFHPRSHPNSQEEWDPWNGRYVSQKPKSSLREGRVVCEKTTLVPRWCQTMRESVLCLVWHPALFGFRFEPINNPSLSSSVSVSLIRFHPQLLFSHKLTSGGGQKHFYSFDFAVWVWWKQLESGWKAISRWYSAICR